MQNRRDHVQAYQFFTSRLSAALVSGNPGTGESPLRRSGLGAMFGVLVAVLLCGVFAVYGLISPGGATSWRTAGSIIVEKETGNRYLFINGTLYPTLNTASAMLYYANGSSNFVDVSRNSLVGVPHGPAVGIPGAPDSVPQSSDMLSGAWALCASSDSAQEGMTVNLDSSVAATPVPAGQRVLVSTGSGADYVVWGDVVHQIGSPAALLALGFGNVQPTHVSASWLSALRQGTVINVPVIDGAGSPGPTIDGRPTVLGQMLATSFSGRGNADMQYYVLLRQGVMPVSRTVLALLSAGSGPLSILQVTPGSLAALLVPPGNSPLSSVPDLVGAPTYQPTTAALCVRQGFSGTSVSAGSLVAEPVAVPDTGTRVEVPPGKGMCAYALPLQPNVQPDLYLITDQGLKFSLTTQAASALGLGGSAVGMPTDVLATMPSGPTLITGSAVLTANRTGGP